MLLIGFVVNEEYDGEQLGCGLLDIVVFVYQELKGYDLERVHLGIAKKHPNGLFFVFILQKLEQSGEEQLLVLGIDLQLLQCRK